MSVLSDAIAGLPHPLRGDVAVASDLVRLGRAIERAPISADERARALATVEDGVRSGRRPEVRALEPAARGLLVRHVPRALRGLAVFARRGGALRDLSDVRAYCYARAGVLGDLVTDILLLRAPHAGTPAALLFRHAVPFAEGLELVALLGGAGGPALPPGAAARVEAIAARDLESGAIYAAVLERSGFAPCVVDFVATLVARARGELAALGRAA